jgi:phospholipase C
VTKNAPYVAECDPQHIMLLTTPKIFGLKNYVHLNFSEAAADMQGFIEVEHTIGSLDNCQVLDMFPPERMPVLTTLAKEFAIMDRFFCSVPGPTWPNRQFAMAATSGGSTETFNWFRGKVGSLFPQKTIFDQVDEAGGSWAVYYVDTPWELFMQSLANKPQNVRTMDSFRAAAESGTLPTYSFINPRSAVNVSTGEGSNDFHPDHDVRLAEAFVGDVYETLRNSPSWNDTLLIVTFDEHGGFYDHVRPPMTGVPAPDDFTSEPDPLFFWDRLGIRIPTLLISPWIQRGTIISEPPAAQKPTPTSEYDLTSIMATVRKVLPMLNTTPPLTKRDAWAATFEHAVESLSAPRGDCPTSVIPPGYKTKLDAAEADREAAQPLNGLQAFITHTLATLVGHTAEDKKKMLEKHTQGSVGGLMNDLHSRHRDFVAFKQAAKDDYKIVAAPLQELWWFIGGGRPAWNVTRRSTGDNIVTIVLRAPKNESR